MSIPKYEDAGHRPHARHDGEEPRNVIVEAPYHLKVELDTWGPAYNLFPSLYDALQANWGDEPSSTVEADDSSDQELWPVHVDWLQRQTGWDVLTNEQRAYVEACFAGRTLPQVLERITFAFRIDGCSRACTHQLVRTRIGAAMMQHGGRDNDWRHRPWIMPETVTRMMMADEDENRDGQMRAIERDRRTGRPIPLSDVPIRHCITNWEPIDRFMTGYADVLKGGGDGPTMRGALEFYLQMGRDLYAAWVDAGIPWEDARRLLWMGTGTYIHIDYNYLALQGVMAKRMEHIMDWEINCVAQLMKREIVMKCPPLFAKYLRSASDIKGQAAFAGLQSWPPDGKYPNPYERCKKCGHAESNHVKDWDGDLQIVICEVCERSQDVAHVAQSPVHQYEPVDTLPREHRPEQNPFWVLHPDSMAGGPIRWVPTNGTYPKEF